MPLIELIIARYGEDPAWIRNIAPGIRTSLYNKGPLPLEDSIQLPNEGREAHTYLHHIVSRYDSLSERNVFCQGKPFDHCSNFHEVLRELSTSGAKPLPSFQWLGFIIDWDDARGERLFQGWSKNGTKEVLDMEGFCRELLPEASQPPFIFYPGAQFIVSRDTILSRSKTFYEKALELSREFPNAAHCFERTWDRVFQVNGLPENYRDQTLPVYLKPIRRLMD